MVWSCVGVHVCIKRVIKSDAKKMFAKIKGYAKKTITIFDKMVIVFSRRSERVKISGPVFIVGPPRSGTTLAYQLFTTCLDFAYITNMEAQRPFAPAIAAIMAKRLDKSVHNGKSFSSQYGRTPGKFGPHEAGQFWYRWFPAGDQIYVRRGELDSERIADIRSYLSFLEYVKNKPLIFKNVYHCARIGALKDAFPEAIFIVIRREPLEIAQSILRAREKVGNGRNEWWSLPLPPPHCVPKNMPWAEQIIRQVKDVYDEIDSQSAIQGRQYFIDVNYASLCSNPKEVIRTVKQLLQSKGVQVRFLEKPPEYFQPGPEKSVSEADYAELEQAIARYSTRRTSEK